MATEITSNTPSVSLPAATLTVVQAPVDRAPVTSKAETAAAKPQQAKLDTDKKLEDVVKDVAQIVRRDLNFSIDRDSGMTVVKVIDPSSKEVVRQIPPEEMLALARRLAEMAQSGEPVSGEAAKGLFMATRA